MDAEKLHAESIALAEERAQLESERAAFLREKKNWTLSHSQIAPRRYRFIAFLVDLWVATMVNVILLQAVPETVGVYSGYLVYFVIMVILTGIFGQSLGKMIFDLKVVMRDGSKLGFQQAFLRETIGRFVTLITFIGLLFPFFNHSQLALHDYIANTIVHSSSEKG